MCKRQSRKRSSIEKTDTMEVRYSLSGNDPLRVYTTLS